MNPLFKYDVINVVLSVDEDDIMYGYTIYPAISKFTYKRSWFIKDGRNNLNNGKLPTNMTCCCICGSLSHSGYTCSKEYQYINIREIEESYETFPSVSIYNQLFILTNEI